MPYLVEFHDQVRRLTHQLALQKAPDYLRFVQDRETCRYDALDLISDTPRATEDVVVYRRRAGKSQRCIYLHFAPGKGRSGWYYWVSYDRLPDSEQPPREKILTRKDWEAWVINRQAAQN